MSEGNCPMGSKALDEETNKEIEKLSKKKVTKNGND
jgi:hypothetical protein